MHDDDEGMQMPPAARAVRWRLRDTALVLPASGDRTAHLMAICNVTPDSFSDGGEHLSVPLAVEYAATSFREGAVLIDIGGESTRPGAVPVSADIELERVLPVVRSVRERIPDALLTIDTVKAGVARAALAAGVHAVNDVSGGRLDPEMFDVVAAASAGIVIMHSRGSVADMASLRMAQYGSDVVGDVCAELMVQVGKARAAGIPGEAIVLDPGIGFSKTSVDSIALLRELHRVVALGFPVLVGASRKRLIGELTGGREPSQRVIGSAVAHAIAVERGASVVRTHDVRATREALAVMRGLRIA